MELKADKTFVFGEECDAYKKSEADNYIAELKERHKEEVDELQKATDSAWGKVNAMYDEIRHQKRKRCLAKADWCEESAEAYELIGNVENDEETRKHLYFVSNNRSKWQRRWLALADKFKE